ncbi:MAG: hypothetical protein LBE34_00650 [Flavobacteriaceae bacterium]|nr:hypothetical protein [Flavobacteriaceae bacterium]
MLSYSTKDSLAKYGNIFFCKIDMIIDSSKNFLGLVALTETSTDTDVKQLIQYISKKEGAPKEQIEDFFGYYKLYTWKNKENLLAVVSRTQIKEKKSQKGKELFKEEMPFDTITPTSINLYFYTIPLQYAEKLTKNLHTGDWLFLKS